MTYIMNNFLKLIFSSILVLFLSFVHAADEEGGWVGAGGDTYTNAKNPWFFKYNNHSRTNVINYCIQMDIEHFSSDIETAKLLIVLSFNTWKNEFNAWKNFVIDKSNDLDDKNFPIVELATENLIYKNCSDSSVDIRFQFGELTKNQHKKLKSMEIDPTEKVALTVRTHYDDKNLRGKGFIYFSPDSGPMRVKGNENSDVIWKNKSILLSILIHEWGHVFGVSHDFKASSIMHVNQPNLMIKKGLYDFMNSLPIDLELDIEALKENKVGIFVAHDMDWMTCGPLPPYDDLYSSKRMGNLRKFLGLKKEESKCIFFNIGENEIKVQVTDQFHGERNTVGRILLSKDDDNIDFKSALAFGIKVITTKDQILFEKIPNIMFSNNIVLGPFKYSVRYTSSYVTAKGKHNVMVRLTTGLGFELIGSVDNSPEILYLSPTTDI